MAEQHKIYQFIDSLQDKKGSASAVVKTRPALKRQARIASRAAVGRSLLLAGAAFLLARAQILGGLYPFGPACLAACAVVWPRRGALLALPVLAGLISGLRGQELLAYLAIVSLLTIVFLLYTLDGKKQWFVVPGMVAAAILVSKGLLIALTAFTDYQLLISLFESLIAAALSLVFLVVMTALRRFDVARRFSADETVCIFIVALGLLCGLSGWSLGLVELQSMFSRLLIIAVAYLGGGGAGAAVGALVGVAPSLSQVIAPTVIATYSFSGLLAGIFSSFGRIGSALGFVLGNLILALYILDPADISAALAASAVAGLIFLIVPAKAYRALARSFAASGLKSAAGEKNERLLRVAVRKLHSSGRAFRDLATALVSATADRQPNEDTNVRTALEQLSHQLCSRCSLRDICWEIDYHETFRGVVSLFESVRDHGLAEIKDAPDNFARRCPHIKELIAIVNCLYDLYCRSNYWQQQRISSRKLIAGQLNGVAEVLEKLTTELVEHGDERETLERELRRAISRRGLPVESAGISSISKLSIDAWARFVECPGEQYCRQAMEEEIGRLLGSGFKVHECSCARGGQGSDGGERCIYRLLAVGAHRFRVGQAQLAKNRETCGDSGGCLLLDEGRQLLLVSDGMGCGDAAAKESGQAISLVSGLIEAGFSQETAIDVVNAALSLRGSEESFVTLDLCVVDLYSGAAEFIKTGASTSYIKRGSAVTTIKGSTLPVGLLYNVEKEVVIEQVTPGDMIILASDGLLGMDIDEEGAWLSRIIGEAVVNDPQTMAEYLLDRVISISSGKIKDDITVLVAQIGEVA